MEYKKENVLTQKIVLFPQIFQILQDFVEGLVQKNGNVNGLIVIMD